MTTTHVVYLLQCIIEDYFAHADGGDPTNMFAVLHHVDDYFNVTLSSINWDK